MKIVFVLLILCVLLNSISAFSWFNSEVKKVTKSVNSHPTVIQRKQSIARFQNLVRDVTNAQRPKVVTVNKNRVNQTPLQRALINRQSYIRYTAAVQRQADNVKKQQNSQAISQNRFRAVSIQQRNPTIARSTTRAVNNANNRLLDSKLRTTVKNNAVNNKNINNPSARPVSRIVNNRVSNARLQSIVRNNVSNNKNVNTATRAVNNANSRLLNSKLQTTAKTNVANNLAARQRTLSQVKSTKTLLADPKQAKPSLIRNNQIHSLQHRTSLIGSNSKNTRTSLLHRALTTRLVNNNNRNAQNQRQLQDNSIYQQRLRAFQNGANPRTNVQISSRRQKRQDEQSDVPHEPINSMIFVRDAPTKDEEFELL